MGHGYTVSKTCKVMLCIPFCLDSRWQKVREEQESEGGIDSMNDQYRAGFYLSLSDKIN